MSKNNQHTQDEPELGKTLLDDLRRGGLGQSVRTDYRALKEFYLNEERKRRLGSMNWFKRFFFMGWWLLKSLFLRLTPARRLLVLLGSLFIIMSGSASYNGEHVQVNTNGGIFGGLLILFVLMLELKDKLTATHELETGRSIQLAMMPPSSPKVEGWDVWLFTRPANEVGGDMVDYLQVDDDTVSVALADVAGKGLGAALLMVKLQSTLRALAPETDRLDKLGAMLNRIFHRDTLRNSFASLVYIAFPPRGDRLQVLNAGHLPPLLMHEETITEIQKSGPALGIVPDASYSPTEHVMQEGDVLLVYSDGITEAKNNRGEFFETPELHALLRRCRPYSARTIGEEILSAVDAFARGQSPHDDISLVVLKRVSGSGRPA